MSIHNVPVTLGMALSSKTIAYLCKSVCIRDDRKLNTKFFDTTLQALSCKIPVS